MTSSSRALITALLIPALLTCCAAGLRDVQESEVKTLLEAQRKAWNAGDLAGFVRTYAADTTFCSGEGVTRGADDLLANYRRRYPTAADRGILRFDLLELRPIGAASALVIGRYQLDRADPTSGYFSLLVTRTAAGLHIVHDHTSESPK